MSIPRDISRINELDLRGLVTTRTPEGNYLEFKRELPRLDAGGRHEFLADVSAFANATGGDVFYGIDEDGEGRANAVVAQLGNSDEEVRRLQDVLLTGIEPRVPGLQVHAIPVAGGFAVVVRVPQSWAGPHRVKSNQHFYIREGGRKRQLDVPEVRSLFLRSENQAQRVRDFRTERIGRLISGEGPHLLVPGALLVGHFVPTQAALGTVQVDPIMYMQQRSLPVLGGTAPLSRVNLDGALALRNPGEGGTHGYSQLFRNGYFESVKVFPYSDTGPVGLGSLAYEEQLITVLRLLRVEYQHLGIGTEMTCMLSLVDATRLKLGLDRHRHELDGHQGFFDRKTIMLPDVMLPADRSPEHALRPVFDLVWQSAGMQRSANYNAVGDWAPIR